MRRPTAPSPAELEQLAAIFDRYRERYGEGSDVSRAAAWLERNVGGGRLNDSVAECDGALVDTQLGYTAVEGYTWLALQLPAQHTG